MKKVSKPVWYLVVAVLAIAIIKGLFLVTQAGQGVNAFQNDGYAVTGAIVIALGSSGLTWWLLKTKVK